MAKTAEVKKALQKQTPQKTLKELIEFNAKELGRALPAHMRPERIVRIALTCIRQNPDLAKCTPESFLGALFTLASIGLEPVAGLAHLIPFKNKRKINGEWKTLKEVQLIIGYEGYVDLFYRHEKSLMLDWGVVKENDHFAFKKGTNAFLDHKPVLTARGETIAYWVLAKLAGGAEVFGVMSREECLAHGKKHSKTYDKINEVFYKSSPWVTSEDSMCLKTTLLQLRKVLPKSMELGRALAVDETSRDIRSGIESLDVTPTTNWEEPEKEVVPPANGSEEATESKKDPAPKDNEVEFGVDAGEE